MKKLTTILALWFIYVGTLYAQEHFSKKIGTNFFEVQQNKSEYSVIKKSLADKSIDTILQFSSGATRFYDIAFNDTIFSALVLDIRQGSHEVYISKKINGTWKFQTLITLFRTLGITKEFLGSFNAYLENARIVRIVCSPNLISTFGTQEDDRIFYLHDDGHSEEYIKKRNIVPNHILSIEDTQKMINKLYEQQTQTKTQKN